ncbi:MAG: hypothetical protein AB1758_35895, partial [Candidatus Eremiobacterota bacterium]
MLNLRSQLIALFVLGCTLLAGAAPGPAPGKIVPGQGIAEVKLGASRQQVEGKLGAPEDTDRNEFNPRDTYALYYSKGIEITYTNDKVAMITLHPAHEQWKAYQGSTKEGLWVGSSPAE